MLYFALATRDKLVNKFSLVAVLRMFQNNIYYVHSERIGHEVISLVDLYYDVESN